LKPLKLVEIQLDLNGGHRKLGPSGGPLGRAKSRNVIASRVIASRNVLASRVLASRVLASRVLASNSLTRAR
jgi:hypothetical protein